MFSIPVARVQTRRRRSFAWLCNEIRFHLGRRGARCYGCHRHSRTSRVASVPGPVNFILVSIGDGGDANRARAGYPGSSPLPPSAMRITYLAGVDESADEIYGDGLEDRRVEGGGPA